MIKLENFKLGVVPSGTTGDSKIDYRNGIECINPTMDLTCYINYIEYLNARSSDWKTFAYLDLGMMPLVMAPSFMHEQMKDVFVETIKTLNIPCYEMPAVSMLNGTRVRDITSDIWVFKEDIGKLLGIPETKVTFSKFMEKIMQYK